MSIQPGVSPDSTRPQESGAGLPGAGAPAPGPQGRKVLVIDVGGTKLKMMVNGMTEPVKVESGKELTPSRMVEMVREAGREWEYEAVSIGFPGLTGTSGPSSEPRNLGPGWVGFDFAAAFDRPVKMFNDAAMQALGSYDGGRMLFLGLGTGLGSTLIAENVIVPLELGQLFHTDGRTLGEVLGRRGLDRSGKREWRRALAEIVPMLGKAFVVDYVVLGGGNARKVKELPAGARLGHNLTAFRGGQRLWNLDDVPALACHEGAPEGQGPREWRVI